MRVFGRIRFRLWLATSTLMFVIFIFQDCDLISARKNDLANRINVSQNDADERLEAPWINRKLSNRASNMLPLPNENQNSNLTKGKC